MRHKKILDVASDNPEATLEAIAAEVPSASPDLVERVLDEYGDPADDDPHTGSAESGESTGDMNDFPDPADLSSKELEVLHAIDQRPEATQRELGNILGVSGTTVSNRANGIDGFKWEIRQDFVQTVLDGGSDTFYGEKSNVAHEEGSERVTRENILDRLTAIERQVAELPDSNCVSPIFEDATLLHKVIHACMSSDVITEEEELHILQITLKEVGE